jgi:hypothetical protein
MFFQEVAEAILIITLLAVTYMQTTYCGCNIIFRRTLV